MKIPVFVYVKKNSWDPDFSYQFWERMMSVPDAGTFVCEREVDIPDLDREALVNGEVKNLRAKQTEIRAEAERQIIEIERQVGELLAIEYKEPAPA